MLLGTWQRLAAAAARHAEQHGCHAAHREMQGAAQRAQAQRHAWESRPGIMHDAEGEHYR